MNIRYRFKFKDGEIIEEILSLREIEGWDFEELEKEGCEILSRDPGTGLKDKKGKEIFERDILEPINPSMVAGRFIVRWDQAKAGFRCIDNSLTYIDPVNWADRGIIGRAEEE